MFLYLIQNVFRSIPKIFITICLFLKKSKNCFKLIFRIFSAGFTVGPSQVYYIKVEVSNFGSNDVTLKWQFDGRDQQQATRGGSVTEIAFAIVSSVTPEPIRFTAVLTSNTDQSVLLNNAQFVEVKPTTYRETTKIQIGMPYLFFSFSGNEN